jgi:hypothetical protein
MICTCDAWVEHGEEMDAGPKGKEKLGLADMKLNFARFEIGTTFRGKVFHVPACGKVEPRR